LLQVSADRAPAEQREELLVELVGDERVEGPTASSAVQPVIRSAAGFQM